MGVHIFINNKLPESARPFLRAWNWAKPRRKTMASHVSDFIALRKNLLLCSGCECRMPWRWAKHYEYRMLPGFHAEGPCDSCRLDGPGNLYTPEEGGYAAQWDKVERTLENARLGPPQR